MLNQRNLCPQETMVGHQHQMTKQRHPQQICLGIACLRVILNLQKSLRKLSFRTKIAEAETGATQLATFQAMNSFDGAIHAFQARMNWLESARSQQSQINSHTLCLILDPKTSSKDGTVQTLTSLVTQESQSARANQEWLEKAGLEDFTPPLPDGWHRHNCKLTRNKGHCKRLLQEDDQTDVDVMNLSDLDLESGSDNDVSCLTGDPGNESANNESVQESPTVPQNTIPSMTQTNRTKKTWK